MEKVFYEVGSLDQRCYDEYGLSEDLLMEHAALSMYHYICDNFPLDNTILIVCGVGNNGADGIALARLLYRRYDVKLYIPFDVKSKMAKLQLSRIENLGIETVNYISSCHVVVDCLFGSGLSRNLDDISQEIISKLNRLHAFKIACDIPSGINKDGIISSVAFMANLTITMGALKSSLFSDKVKNYIGDIVVANLGIQRELYEIPTNTYLLEIADLKLPNRVTKSSHKGNFGHSAIIVGEKKGAGIIASEASFAFGSGLVTAISHQDLNLPYHIMQSHKLPKNTTSIALGMGLGNFEFNEIKELLHLNTKKVIDADLFYDELILDVLNQDVVLTPHPKEFSSLLKLTGIADISVEELQNNRLTYVRKFSQHFKSVTLLLKGANTMISHDETIYINFYGTPALSKGGSGDVLTGLIASLLAQGYDSLDAAIHSSLAHSLAAQKYSKNNYSLQPQDLIEEVKKL